MSLSRPASHLLLGGIGVMATAVAARQPQVSTAEAAVFHRLNGLPDAVHAPAWVVMQGGALGAAPAGAAVAALLGDGARGIRLLVSGSTAWVLAKIVKGGVRRPRPAALVDGTRIRGREASGLGFVSGHAAVSTSLAAVVSDRAPLRFRVLAGSTAATVGLARIYVGAHLPLDVVGGLCVGLAVHGALGIALDHRREGADDPAPAGAPPDGPEQVVRHRAPAPGRQGCAELLRDLRLQLALIGCISFGGLR